MTLQQELRSRYKKGGGWRELFDMLSTYTNRVGATTADNAKDYTGLAYETVITLLRELDELGAGEFKFGRRGGKTRIIWNYSPASLGGVANGELNELDAYNDSESLGSDYDEELPTPDLAEPTPVKNSQPMSLGETLLRAKRQLAAELGLQPEQIEITIKH